MRGSIRPSSNPNSARLLEGQQVGEGHVLQDRDIELAKSFPDIEVAIRRGRDDVLVILVKGVVGNRLRGTEAARLAPVFAAYR